MNNHLIKIVLQSIWSSLTGGWFYDPHLSLFINTVHMYIWIFLFMLPFSFYILFPSNFITWSSYTGIILIFFIVLKTINYKLNCLFDKNKMIIKEKIIKNGEKRSNSINKKRIIKPRTIAGNNISNKNKCNDSLEKLSIQDPFQSSQTINFDLLGKYNIKRNNELNIDNNSKGRENYHKKKKYINKNDSFYHSPDINGNKKLFDKRNYNFGEPKNFNSNKQNIKKEAIEMKKKYDFENSDFISKIDVNLNKNLRNDSARSLFKISEESLSINVLKETSYSRLPQLKIFKSKFSDKLRKNNTFLSINDNSYKDSIINSTDHTRTNFNYSNDMIKIFTKNNLKRSQSETSFKKITEKLKIDYKKYFFHIEKNHSTNNEEANLSNQSRILSEFKADSQQIEKKLNILKLLNSESQSRNHNIRKINKLERSYSLEDISYSLKIILFKDDQHNLNIFSKPSSINTDESGLKKKLKNIDNSTCKDDQRNELYNEIENNSEINEKRSNKNNSARTKKVERDYYKVSKIQLSTDQKKEFERQGAMPKLRNFQTGKSVHKKYFSNLSIEKLNLSKNQKDTIRNKSSPFFGKIPFAYETEKSSTYSSKEDGSTIFTSNMVHNPNLVNLNKNMTINNNKNKTNENYYEKIIFDDENKDDENILLDDQHEKLFESKKEKNKLKSLEKNYLFHKKKERVNYSLEKYNASFIQKRSGSYEKINTVGLSYSKLNPYTDTFYKNKMNDTFKLQEFSSQNYQNIYINTHERDEKNKKNINNFKINKKQFSSALKTNTVKSSIYLDKNKFNKDLNKKISQVSNHISLEQIRMNEFYEFKKYDDIYDDIIDSESINETNLLDNFFQIKNNSRLENEKKYGINLINSPSKTSNYRLNNFLNEKNNQYRSKSLSSLKKQNTDLTYNSSDDKINLKSQSNLSLNSNYVRHSFNNRLVFKKRFQDVSHENSNNSISCNFELLLDKNVTKLPNEKICLKNDYQYIDSDDSNYNTKNNQIKKIIYRLKITKFLTIKIPFDHFTLNSMFDKNQNIIEVLSTILISFLVSVFASLILYEKLYDDILVILFCFIVASCHYSLIKSVQPDSSSPIHGFNNLTTLSRPIYFCLTCFLIFFIRFLTINDVNIDSSLFNNKDNISIFYPFLSISKHINEILEKFSFYGYFIKRNYFELCLYGLQKFLLFFPLVFTFGLFPQISTFFLCIIEQVDMLLFGGTPMINFSGAILSLLRSIIFTLILSIILFYSVPSLELISDRNNFLSLLNSNNYFSKSFIFSIYCGCVVTISYILSRQSSNLGPFFSMIRDLLNINEKDNQYNKNNKYSDLTKFLYKSNIFIHKNNNSNNSNKKIQIKSEKDLKFDNISNMSKKDDNYDELYSLIDLNYKNIDESNLQRRSKCFSKSSYISINKDSDYKSVYDYSNLFNSSHSKRFDSLTSLNSQQDLNINDIFSNKNVSKSRNKNKVDVKNNNFISNKAGCSVNKDNLSGNIDDKYLNVKMNNMKNEKYSSNDKHKINMNLKKSYSDFDFNIKNDEIGQKINKQEKKTKLSQDFIYKNKKIIRERLESDLFFSFISFLLTSVLHVSTVFSGLIPCQNDFLYVIAIIVGLINHHIIPNLRLENPWYIFNQPLLKPRHWSIFEPNFLAKIEFFEKIHVFLKFLEKNILNVIVILSSITTSIDSIFLKYLSIDPKGYFGCIIISIISLKLLRNSFCNPAKQYQIFLITFLFNKYDSDSFKTYKSMDDGSNLSINVNEKETTLFNLFFISILLNKLDDFLQKMQFIFIYTAPWQLPWGSAFHAFAQPLSAPHTSLLLLQAFISTLIGSPLMPFMGSAIFLLSYIRPIKFWEKNYSIKKQDNNSSIFRKNLNGNYLDNENLNAIFYEHLTTVLQNTLCGDILMGRWGNVQCGDFYVLSSDYLNCLVHIIEMGNGFVTFQLRGLEFKGTYCQQRELEAITEDKSEDKSFCCCKIKHLRYMLSFNAAFNQRCLAWSLIARKYIVNAYRIIDNDFSLIINFFSLRRTLIDFYIKSVIYYCIDSPNLFSWLKNPIVNKMLNQIHLNYVDYDSCFDSNLNFDFDSHLKGVSLIKFSKIYAKWIDYCRIVTLKKLNQHDSNNLAFLVFLTDNSKYSTIVKFCFAISLVCRRSLSAASIMSTMDKINNEKSKNSFESQVNENSSNIFAQNRPFYSNINNEIKEESGLYMNNSNLDTDSLESFQYGYFNLFKGNIQIQSEKDEWVLVDVGIIKNLILPGVRMGLRLHQEHFQNDISDECILHQNIIKFENECVISYEKDEIWRSAVLNSIQSLLSLRHQLTEYSDQYKVVMLNKSFLSFRIIKINKECVRSFWASQQHELIFLRNKNQERGSIQNAKQVLRNIINSSCDQPIGYPIYVSPLTTSYSSSHKQISQLIGSELSFKRLLRLLFYLPLRLRGIFIKRQSAYINNNLNDKIIKKSCSNYSNKCQNYTVSYSNKSDACNFNLNGNIEK